jgi:hypothetical protein
MHPVHSVHTKGKLVAKYSENFPELFAANEKRCCDQD